MHLPSGQAERAAVEARRFLLTIGAVLFGLGACAAVAPLWPLSPLIAYVLAFSCVAASAISVAIAARVGLGRWAAWWWLGPALVSLLSVRLLGLTGLGAALAVAAALLAAGSVVGTLVGRAIEHPGHLLFVALVSSLADTFSVAHPDGPSAAIVAAPEALSLLAISWPLFGTDRIEPLLGVGDVVFTALYVAACRAHGLSMARTTLALGVAFLVTMLTVMATELPVPALPFLGLAILAAHPASRRPPAKDRARGLAVVGVLAVVVLVLFVRRWL